MMDTTEYRESVDLFGRNASLLGITTAPVGPSKGLPIVILSAGILHRMGPSRVSVHLARQLAAAGHRVLRFDLSGIGDSARATDGSLSEVVLKDIRDAIDHILSIRDESGETPGRVVLVGYCSGADNAFYYAVNDPRVAAIALFDPTIHETAGFRRRELIRRLTSPRAWRNVLSGRSLRSRIQQRFGGGTAKPPPDYYGLLVAPPADADARASALAERGTRVLYLLSSGARHYCNAPEQIWESLPTGFSPDLFSVAWAPDVDHVLSTVAHQERLKDILDDWLEDCGLRASTLKSIGAA